MEESSQQQDAAKNLQADQDMNFSDQVEGINQPFLPSNNEIEFASLTVEEMESRLTVGQPMQNELVAFGLYSIYARRKGFSVRKSNVEYFRDGSGIRARDFICSCGGDKDEKRSRLSVPAYVKPTYRCRCKAKIRVARLKGQDWRITGFNKEHTHDMYSADQTHLLRSARILSPEMEKCIERMVACGIPVARVYDYLQSSSNGRENVGFTQKDIHNSLSRTRRQSKVESGDAIQLVQHFIEKSNNEHGFYWNVERDENKRLMNLFFRDYRCSIDYEYFGDVLSFDTTYRTNKFNMICCPLIGINHHLQNVMFGFAFMSDETESSFEWLFRTFLKSMGGKQPETIFTDQDQAMMNAIETVFPDSHHRLCQWHISQNTPSHFGSLNGDKDFLGLWHKCMSGCDEEEEFEQTWKQMVDEYQINTKSWFNQMYNLRHKWATVFSCHKFSAGLKASSRSEGTNAALKRKFGGATSSLYDCVISFEKVQESWRMNEKEKDTRSHHGKLPVGHSTWLGKASATYTMEIFVLFQEEVSKAMDFSITEALEDVETSLMRFQVKPREKKSKNFIVYFDSQTSYVNCSCHKFETFGILCRHALKVFDRLNMDDIPKKYIKRRWTKSVTGRVWDIRQVSDSGANGLPCIAFVHETTRGSYNLAARAQFHKETRFIVTEALEDVNLKLDSWFENFNISGPKVAEGVGVDEDNSQTNEILIHDPQHVRSRGITDVHMRHWDAKGKKTKGRTENSKKPAKCTRKKGQCSQTVEDASGSQDVYAQASQGYLQQRAITMHPSFHQPSQYQYVYPSQYAFLVNQQAGETQPLQDGAHQFPAAHFTNPLLTHQIPWNYAPPSLARNPGVGENSNMVGHVTENIYKKT